MTAQEAIDAMNSFIARWDRLNGTIVRSKAFDKEATTLFVALVGRKPDKDELKRIGD